MSATILKLTGVLVLIGLNAFFVAIEFAVIASRRTRVERLAVKGSSRAKIVLGWVQSQEDKDKLIAASQVGITIASLALGYLGEGAVASIVEPLIEHAGIEPTGFMSRLLDNIPLIISLIAVTGLHVTLGEQVPKVISLRAPETTAMYLAPWMVAFNWAARPFIWTLDRVTALILRQWDLQPLGAHSAIYTVDELKLIVEESEQSGILDTEEREMLHAVFAFGDLVARQVMIPRTEMVCIQADASLDEALDLAAETLLTKFPVYEGDLDNIIGILHTKDVVKIMRSGPREASMRSLTREAIFLPESVPVDDLLTQLRQRCQHIAILLDEFAGTAGLVTLEDLMEELVGNVQDAFDRPEPGIQHTPDGSVLIDGLVPIEEVNDAFGLNLVDPNYDTIAGYVLGRLGRIGIIGDVVEAISNKRRLRFQVEAMDSLRIARLKLEISADAPPGIRNARDRSQS
jgi:CBS domain containing-hemolysin-like protein